MTSPTADQIVALVTQLQTANADLVAFDEKHAELLIARAAMLKTARDARVALGLK